MVFDEYYDEWLKELFELLSIPSVSTNPINKIDIQSAANYTEQLLRTAGCTKTQIISEYGNPIVYGEYIFDDSKPTILIYGHYDVQPAGEEKLWHSKPFSPEIKVTNIHPDGAIFARGASDQKGQLFIHIKALEYVLKHEQLYHNVKFIIEGEEEIGSINLHRFVSENKELLKSDVILISDTAFVDRDVPTVTTSLRGFTGAEVCLSTTKDEAHSGLCGGALMNPVFELCRLIGNLKNDDWSINIEGFYDDVLIFSEEFRESLNQHTLSIETSEAKFLKGEVEFSPMEQVSIRPSLDIHGIKGGFIENGIKTIIPNKASAKISMRLVANQKATDIQNKLINYFKSEISKEVLIEIDKLPCAEPYIINSDNYWLIELKKSMRQVFKKDVYELMSGGSLPIVSTFEKELGCKSILVGFGLNTDNIHGINEHFGIKNLFQGIETIVEFLKLSNNV